MQITSGEKTEELTTGGVLLRKVFLQETHRKTSVPETVF